MDVDELFAGNQTIMRPRPGGGRKPLDKAKQNPAASSSDAPLSPASSSPIPPQQATPVAKLLPAEVSHGLPISSSLNPLLHTAANLLSFVHSLRNTADYPQPSPLFDEMIEQLQEFQQRAIRAGYDRYDVTIASELLCCFIDEAVRTMPWSTASSWTTRSLLNQLHQGGQGGEHFFAILDRLLDHSKQKLHLVELAYLLLSLGFQGRYRLVDNGCQALQGIRTQVYRHIEKHRGKAEPALSVNWQGIAQPQQTLDKMLPIWVYMGLACCALLLLYTLLLFSLNKQSDPVAIKMVSLGRDIPVFKGAPAPQPEPVLPRLAELLAAEIRQGLLSVELKDNDEVAILKGDRFFASGSGEVKTESAEVIRAVATALQQLPGEIVISGHTDNIPIQTLRYPSNWDLSKARALSVAQGLALDNERITVEALGETEPKFDNNSAQNRALNRRVEIMLIANKR